MSMQTKLTKALRLSDDGLVALASFAVEYADALLAPKSDEYKLIAECVAAHYKVKVPKEMGQRGWTFEGDDLRVQAAKTRVSEMRRFIKTGSKKSAQNTDPVAKAIKQLDGLTTAQLKKVLAHFRAM